MGPPDRPRKRKAPTLRADDWEPYKKRILDLHITQNLPLPKVRQIIEEEYGFKAELRQYRSRISQWRKDKNVKPQEMEAIVRKRQKRKLVETNKGPLVFEVRGSQVEPQKIERWMKRHDIADSFLYAPSPVAHLQFDFIAVSSTFENEIGVDVQPRYREEEEKLLLDQIIEAEMSLESSTLDISGMLYRLGSVLIGQGRYRAAEVVARKLVESHESQSGSGDDDAETLKSWEFLGRVLYCQGLYVKAERLLRRALKGEKKVLGPEHPDTLVSMGSLALMLGRQGRYKEAEEMHRETLALRKKVLGPEHPDTLRSMGSLALVLDRQGRYKEAEEMHRETLALRKKVLGPEHPDTLRSMGNLALVLDRQGRYEEAEEMHRRALKSRK
ncbi:hypothetical protein SLS56_012249 [Neofusicoccum ribis]|uniref:Clr5 domain-containing protein n=1 Tax=Neofusicoccum ribis TaxID=45134 RepID=A0ABR3S9D0_9PEZI